MLFLAPRKDHPGFCSPGCSIILLTSSCGVFQSQAQQNSCPDHWQLPNTQGINLDVQKGRRNESVSSQWGRGGSHRGGGNFTRSPREEIKERSKCHSALVSLEPEAEWSTIPVSHGLYIASDFNWMKSPPGRECFGPNYWPSVTRQHSECLRD